MAIESEIEFLTRLQKGEEAALLSLLQRYQPLVWSICRNISGSREDAEEATQDTFLKLLEKAHTFEGHSSLKTWIYRIAVNEALMHRRAAGRAKERSLEGLEAMFDEEGSHIREIPDWTPLPEEILLSDEQKRIIQEAIDHLPEAYRTALLLGEMEGLSMAEISEITGDSVTAVKTRLHRARIALRNELAPYFQEKA